MSSKYVVKEQIYHDLDTGAITQIRQEISDGSIEWERADGSVWNGPIHDPVSGQVRSACTCDPRGGVGASRGCRLHCTHYGISPGGVCYCDEEDVN